MDGYELVGPPGPIGETLAVLMVGDSGSNRGVIEDEISFLSSMPPSGYFYNGDQNFIENGDNLTFLLVSGFTEAAGDDLDLDDDGVFEFTPWVTVIDSVSLVAAPSVDDGPIYSPNVVGPDGQFLPGHVRVCSGVWEIGEFDASLSDDSLGARNPCGTNAVVGYCDPANVNSTGLSAQLTYSYAPAPWNTHYSLDVLNGPPNEFGYFLVGSATAPPVAVSNGLLCLAGSGGNVIGRYNVLTPGSDLNGVGQFNAVGNFRVSSPLWSIPNTLPLAGQPLLMPGSTWHFQLWYRDTASGAGASNFSNGLSISF